VCHIVEGGGFWDFGKLYLSLPTNLYPLIKATNNCPSRPRRIALFGIIGEGGGGGGGGGGVGGTY
jgi:hypothetical protein